MKAIIPIDENKESVCPVFARAPYFLVCDTESGDMRYTENSAAFAESGAGVKAAQLAVDLGADVLITVRLGENSAELLKEAECTIYKAAFDKAIDNIEAFKKGELSELTHFHSGYHGKA